ncbi:PHP domain-containing protein [Desulfovibrio aerotolerans]|uniref:PHP domain-containing protein n=1 Tax=Solidesulfovibrio aerotolerans TaxID=295255 RepID=A0A7C9IQC4_9BACT|nr:PHP domain-containing protein [Solidesulfovibrio aerotolerans]MYL85259.1 PHP domain-containing protein [Solidesulfovibrio aerotolerans]
MLFDIHVHSDLSPCSHLPLSDILKHARRRGLDGVCITDHGTMAVGSSVREGVQEDGLCVIVGMEYTTPQGDFLVFGPLEHLPQGLDAQDLLARVDCAGGAAVAAHPFRPGRSVLESVFTANACRLVEAVNGRNPAAANEQALALIRRRNLVGLGGSDAHSLAELGRMATRIHTPVHGRNDFIRALRQGRCQHHVMPLPPAPHPLAQACPTGPGQGHMGHAPAGEPGLPARGIASGEASPALR